jgi:hypothetical protein
MEWNWRSVLKWFALALVAGALIWVVRTFAVSEQTQMLRIHSNFIQSLEKRKWSAVEPMICSDYADEWGNDADLLKSTMRELLGQFLFLSLTPTITEARTAKGLGMVKCRIKVEGNGAGLSAMVMAEANRVKEPWVFHWHKRGRWPWSWELVQIHNKQLAHGHRNDAPER